MARTHLTTILLLSLLGVCGCRMGGPEYAAFGDSITGAWQV